METSCPYGSQEVLSLSPFLCFHLSCGACLVVVCCLVSSCFKMLGRNHAKFVASLVNYLVSLHPFFDVIEPDINDMFCM